MARRPKDAVLGMRSRLHRAVFSSTGGRLLGRWGGLPVVMLSTVGRRSGRRRSTILVSPLQDGERIVLVASNGGHSHHPDWFHNLVAHPEVHVAMSGRRGPLLARVATPVEKQQLWPRITARSPSYERYQRSTSRDIPVVLLEPMSPPPDDVVRNGPHESGRPPFRQS